MPKELSKMIDKAEKRRIAFEKKYSTKNVIQKIGSGLNPKIGKVKTQKFDQKVFEKFKKKAKIFPE